MMQELFCESSATFPRLTGNSHGNGKCNQMNKDFQSYRFGPALMDQQISLVKSFESTAQRSATSERSEGQRHFA
jgi:hypothetical protein